MDEELSDLIEKQLSIFDRLPLVWLNQDPGIDDDDTIADIVTDSRKYCKACMDGWKKSFNHSEVLKQIEIDLVQRLDARRISYLRRERVLKSGEPVALFSFLGEGPGWVPALVLRVPGSGKPCRASYGPGVKDILKRRGSINPLHTPADQ